MQANSDFKISCSFWSPKSDNWIVPWCLVDFWYASWVKAWFRSDFVVYHSFTCIGMSWLCPLSHWVLYSSKDSSVGGSWGCPIFWAHSNYRKQWRRDLSRDILGPKAASREKDEAHCDWWNTGETTNLQTWEYFGLNPWAPRCSVRGPGESFHNIPSPCVLFCT